MMMHPLLAASVATTLFNDRAAAAATRTRRVRRKNHDGTRLPAASDDTSGAGHMSRAEGELVIRRATQADSPALVRLGTLDSNRRAGRLLAEATEDQTVLVAEIDGSIQAALALDDDVAVADPFRPSGIHAQLLELRARQLGGHAARRTRGFGVLHPRTS
jgi:hypothetical protein